jgi:hypothetical protein
MQFWRLLRNRAQRRTAWRACVVHATDRYVEKRMRGYFDCWRVAAHCLKNKAPVEFEMPEVLDVVDFIRWVRAALTEQQRLRSMSLPHGDTLPLYASAVDDELLMPAVGTRESYLHPTRPLRAHPASAPGPLPHLHRDLGLPAPHPHRDLGPPLPHPHRDRGCLGPAFECVGPLGSPQSATVCGSARAPTFAGCSTGGTGLQRLCALWVRSSGSSCCTSCLRGERSGRRVNMEPARLRPHRPTHVTTG